VAGVQERLPSVIPSVAYTHPLQMHPTGPMERVAKGAADGAGALTAATIPQHSSIAKAKRV